MKINLPLAALNCCVLALTTAAVSATSLLRGSGNNNATTVLHHERSLETEDFVPLSCNRNFKRCESWTKTFGTDAKHSQRLIIGCGKCVEMDFGGPTLELLGGLDIQGKLVVPDKDDYRLTIEATMIVVQGELEITSTKPVDGDPMIRFVMIGEEDEFFTPVDENANACGDSEDCNVGKKGIVVAGGTVNSKCVCYSTNDCLVASPNQILTQVYFISLCSKWCTERHSHLGQPVRCDWWYNRG